MSGEMLAITPRSGRVQASGNQGCHQISYRAGDGPHQMSVVPMLKNHGVTKKKKYTPAFPVTSFKSLVGLWFGKFTISLNISLLFLKNSI